MQRAWTTTWRGWGVVAWALWLSGGCGDLWRYSSGVVRADGVADLGAADATPEARAEDLPCPRPEARLAVTLEPECPGARLILDSAGSRPGDCGGALARVGWRVIRPDGRVLLDAAGMPDDEVAPTGAASGTYGSPRVSLMSRDGEGVAELQHYGGAPNRQLYQTGFLLEPKHDYELALTVRAEPPSELRRVFVHQHSDPYKGYGLDVGPLAVASGWTSFSLPLTTNELLDGTPTSDTRVQLRLGGNAGQRFWFARVRLTDLATGEQLLDDPDFDLPVLVSLWRAHFDDGGTFDVVEVESTLEGTYAVELTVTDERGDESTAQDTVAVKGCP